jgi:hypothetical protein
MENFNADDVGIKFYGAFNHSYADCEPLKDEDIPDGRSLDDVFYHGLMQLYGIHSAPKDPFGGLKMISLAAESGLLIAQYTLMRGFLNGEFHLEKNPLISEGWLQRMAEENSEEDIKKMLEEFDGNVEF